MGAKQFEDLEVWRAAKAIVVDIYRLTARGGLARDFGFRDQIQRAAVSVMSNIAEGFERGGNREFIHFLYIAKASAGEVRSLAHAASDLGYVVEGEKSVLLAKLASVSRQLGALIRYLQQTTDPR